jgi:glycosyltransferase involved in cell wall biosynthesis
VRVSVITACFNSAATVLDTIRSVAGQSHGDIEHVFVDGGSRDVTLDIIRANCGPNARILTGPDAGIYDALNKGLAASSGEVISFLHADDIYASVDVVSTVVQAMAADSLDALYGDVEFVRPENLAKVVRLYSSRRFSPSRIAWGWMPAHPALFVSASVFRRFGGFKTDYKIAGDFEFIARVFSKPQLRYRYVPEVLVRMRTGGLSTRGWRSTITINQESLRACRENGIRSNYLKILSKYPAKALEFLLVNK